MTLTDELKIFDDKVKANQAQHDLDIKVAKISALSAKKLDKYEYLTGEDLEYKPRVAGKNKFEYSPLGGVLSGKVKKDKQNNEIYKVIKKDKQNKILVYNQQDRFAKFKYISAFKQLLLNSMHKKLN